MEPVVQRFSDEYLERCRELSPTDIVRFLDSYRETVGVADRGSRQISIRVPETLLEAFKMKAQLHRVPYQSLIKRLMREWLVEAKHSQ